MNRPVVLGVLFGLFGVPLVVLALLSAGPIAAVVALLAVALAGGIAGIEDDAGTSCHHCGTTNDDDSDRCRVCGAAL